MTLYAQNYLHQRPEVHSKLLVTPLVLECIVLLIIDSVLRGFDG